MNLISILYLANNKVGLMAQFLPFKLGVMSSIPEKKKKKKKEHPSQYPKQAKSVVASQQPSKYRKLAKSVTRCSMLNIMKLRLNDNLKYLIIYISPPT